MGHWKLGAVEVTRVDDPGYELVLPQDEATTERLRGLDWLARHYLTPEASLRVGSSAIAVRTPSAVMVIDPWLAFDDPARLAPRLAALRAAGIDPDEVDLVLYSHIDGISGGVQGDGSPTFPNARYLLHKAELEDLRAGLFDVPTDDGRTTEHPLIGLDRDGRCEALLGDEHLLPGVLVEDAPGHSRGHVNVWLTSGGEQAVVTGHLFLHPAQIADPSVVTGDVDPTALVATRREVLARCVEDDVLLLGPLFAAPGGGKVRADGATWRLEPA